MVPRFDRFKIVYVPRYCGVDTSVNDQVGIVVADAFVLHVLLGFLLEHSLSNLGTHKISHGWSIQDESIEILHGQAE